MTHFKLLACMEDVIKSIAIYSKVNPTYILLCIKPPITLNERRIEYVL